MRASRLLALLLFALAGLTACESRETVSEVERVVVPRPFESGETEPRATVRAAVQPEPGGPTAETSFPVYGVPVGPPAVPASEAALESDDLVLGLVLYGQAVAFPVRYLAPYGVVNDEIGGLAVAVTWSSLSGSGAIYARSFGGSTNTFDFGAAVFKNNLLLVDRKTGSVWSQLSRRAIAGPMGGTKLEIVPALQTTWEYWRRVRPDTRVMVVEGEKEQPYFYQRFDAAEGYSIPAESPSHDTRDLGLGIVAGDRAHFFPLEALSRHLVPVIIGEGSDRITVLHKDEGLTAWAEDAQGLTIGSVLCYRDSWLAFYPDAAVFSVEE